MRPHDSLWDGAHEARLTGDVVDEIPGGKVDRADWAVAPDDPRTGARPRPYPSRDVGEGVVAKQPIYISDFALI